jgi:3-oxoacyl-[acyl-carrier protein] reductase
MTSLNGKTAIVTGASKGIGAAIALGIAAAGANVVVNFASDQAGADRVVARIRDKGGKAIAVKASVANPSDVTRLFAEAVKAFGAPSVLVNNAGVFSFDPIAAVTPENFHWQFDTNVLGTLLMNQEAVKQFPEAGGSIINISSIASGSAMPNSSVYAATKAAVDQVTRALAKELGARNIRVNSVAPGHTLTEGLEAIGMASNETISQITPGTPLGRAGKPEDIVPAVVFLASDAAGWITGERIAASGGLRF